MNTSRCSSAVLLALALLGTHGARAAVDPVQAVSWADPNRTPSASAAGDSLGSVIAPDGSFVVFLSNAGNLGSNSAEGRVVNVFRRTRTNGVTTLVSVNASGTGGGNRHSVASGYTPDGRYVAFVSAASDLIADDTNAVSDVFVRDLVEAKTVLVSLNASGQCANGASSEAVITPDGRFVAFVSAASDLVPEDTNDIPDVFVRDLQTGTTTLASAGAQSSRDRSVGSGSPAISADGRIVALVSAVTNALAGTANIYGDVLVTELSTGTLRSASRDILAGFQEAFGATAVSKPASYGPVLSEDGRWLAFKTSAHYTGGTTPSSALHCLVFRFDLQTDQLDLIGIDAEPGTVGYPDASGPAMTPDGSRIAYTTGLSGNAPRSVVCWDAAADTTIPVSANLSGVLSTNGASDAPALSADGRFVAFLSNAADLATNTVNGRFQVYVRDLTGGSTRLISADTEGVGSGAADGAMPTLSDDGRWVAFDSASDRLVPDDGNRAFDAFVRDTLTETTELVSAAATGLASSSGNGFSGMTGHSVSADGRIVVYSGFADNLAAGSADRYLEVYARDLVSGTNLLVSVGADGSPANGSSLSPVISTNGRYVAFVSTATNLVTGNVTPRENVYVRDLVAGTTALVSVNRVGTGGGNGSSPAFSLSADGRRVAFQSSANDLVLADQRYTPDVFIRDLEATTTTLVSVTNPGTVTGTSYTAPVMSPDGRFVAFAASLSGSRRLLIKDLQTGKLTDFGSTNVLGSVVFSGDSRRLVFLCKADSLPGKVALLFRELTGPGQRLATFGAVLSTIGDFHSLSVNGDGRVAAFSWPQALLASDTNQVTDVYLYDSGAGNLTLVSANAQGTSAANASSDCPSMSADGRFITYHSTATDLVAGDFNDDKDVFLLDRWIGQTTLISAVPTGFGWPTERSSHPLLNTDANLVVFRSLASGFVAGDFNATQDLFATPFTPEAVVLDPHPEFACELLLIGDGLIQLSWNAAPGRAYRARYTEDLGAPTWNNVAGTVNIVGSRAWIQDSAGGAGRPRFYQVWLVE